MKLYFLALLPPEAIRNDIKSLKLEIAEKFGARQALKLPAHITLQRPFKYSEDNERDLLKDLREFAREQEIFRIDLNGFGSFPHRVIFVDVENKEPLINLHKKLRQHLAATIPPHEQDTSFHPHLTLATRDLHRQSFSDAWEDFKDKKYKSSFIAENISLMKHNGESWQIHAEMKLAGKIF